MVNIFAWWPQISEKLPESFESNDDNNESLKPIDFDGAGIYWKFDPEKAKKQKEQTKTPEEIQKEKKKLKEELSKTVRNFNNFKSDVDAFKKIEWLEKYDFQIEWDWFKNEVLNKIWKNYLKTETKEWTYDVEKDLQKAIFETKNQIEEEVVNLPKTSETYKVAIKQIQSWDIEQQLKWIETLYVLAYSWEWKFAKKKLDKYKEKQKKNLIEEYQKVQKEIEELKKQTETQKTKQKLEELQKQKESIEKQAKELEAWDIFEAWENDKISAAKEQKETK